MYYSYDPEDGIEFHDTAEQAKSRAEKALEDAEFHAADSDWSWNENEAEISWGEVRGKVTVTDRPLDDEEKKENPEWESIRNLSFASTVLQDDDTERLKLLEDLMLNCPHAELTYNDDQDEGLVGYGINVDGCEPISIFNTTLRGAIDQLRVILAQRQD
jgi:hypothetical protein